MNIIVCIKQVPDTTDVKINPQTNTLIRDGVRSVMNPFDAYAIEEALRLRENYGGAVFVVTMGPPQSRQILEEALAMGANDAFLVSDRAFAGSDTLSTSYVLSQAIKRIGDFDLIICGKQATDGDTAQVGPGIAVRLEIPQATFVRKISSVEGNRIILERLMDEGYDVISLPLPCLMTVVKEINVPRYASFPGKVHAKRKRIPVWGPKDIDCDETKIGLDGSPTWVEKMFPPPARRACTPLSATEDNTNRIATEIFDYLKDIKVKI